jgi:hypothetical protein
MKTAIQHLIHSFENDKMQSTYSKEQILNLLNFMLEQEKQQLKEAWINSLTKGDYNSAEEYYNKTFKP